MSDLKAAGVYARLSVFPLFYRKFKIFGAPFDSNGVARNAITTRRWNFRECL